MFNGYSAPSFAAALLFWLLAAYVLTRSPFSLLSVATALAQVATAAYFLGQGMQANASSAEEWLPWARNLYWGATIAPTIWYGLTILLLRDQPTAVARAYLRWIGYPLGALFTVLGIVLTVAIYVGDLLFVWSEPVTVPAEQATYYRFTSRSGVLYTPFVVHLVATTTAAAINLGVAWRQAGDPERRRLVRWLFLSAVLLAPAVSAFSVATWLGLHLWPTWVTDLAVATTVAVMTSNVGAYGLFLRGQVIGADLLHFLSALGLICLTYAAVFVAIGPPFSFSLLVLLATILGLTILTHGLANLGRRALDRFFFRGDVQRLRWGLTQVVDDAALTRDQDLDRLVVQARTELVDVSAEHLTRLTEEALRRLNTPAALSTCGLVERLPRTIAAARVADTGGAPESSQVGTGTPLEEARALRQAVIAAVERLRPSDAEAGASTPGALQYHILREEYVLGRPNKQIMARHSISEGTFHRNRREAIAILARELGKQEDLRALAYVDSFWQSRGVLWQRFGRTVKLTTVLRRRRDEH